MERRNTTSRKRAKIDAMMGSGAAHDYVQQFLGGSQPTESGRGLPSEPKGER